MQLHIGYAPRAILALMVLALAARYDAAADGVVVPLPTADQEQLEKMLGKGIVGEAQPAVPLGTPESYLPPMGSSMSFQVVEKSRKTTETHKLEDTTDASLAPGWHYSVENAGAPFFRKYLTAASTPSRNRISATRC